MKSQEDSQWEIALKRAISVSEFNRQIQAKKNDLHDIINQRIKEQMDWLREEAQNLTAEYNSLNEIIRKNKTMHEWGTLTIVIRENKHSFAIEWYQNNFMKINGQWRVFKKRMKFNKKDLRFSFKKANRPKTWEVREALDLENRFSVLRNQINRLIAINRLTLASKQVNK
ncbi:conjugative transfer protein MobI(A/C) [Thorsellia kenyensis]|uniref:Conjugative transfer protein MobI(A/C) n=1 Tax=Thorsellia kenyensis TaxID=1549888 RepID=A0ABV6CIB4_9GAMM